MKRKNVISIVFLMFLCSLLLSSHSVVALNEFLIIESHSFSDNKEIQNNDWELKLTFSHPVALERLPHFIHLEQNGERKALNISHVQGNAKQTENIPDAVSIIYLSPSSGLEGSISNKIIVESGLYDTSGQHVLTKDFLLAFRSVDVFTIAEIAPSDVESKVELYFSDWISMDKLRYKLKVSPPAAIRWYHSYVDSNNILFLEGDFARGTEYLITLPKDFKSIHGLEYVKTTNTFLMPHHRPEVKFPSDKTVIERDSRQLLNIDLINIDEVLVEGIQIPPLVVPLAQSFLVEKKESGTDEDFSIEDVLNRIDEDYQQFLNKCSGIAEFSPFFGDSNLDRQLFFNENKQDEWQPFSLPLTWRKNKNKGVIEIFRMVNNRGNGHSDCRLFRLTDMGITAKLTDSSAFIWLTSLKTGKPLEGVSLLAYDKNLTAYYLGQTNSDGVLTITPQKNYISVHFNDKVKAFTNHPLANQLTYIVAVSNDDVSYLEIKDNQHLKFKGINHQRGSGAGNDTVKGMIFTDRGVYRPGDTVHIKGVVRSQFQGDISVPNSKKCRITIEDAKHEEYLSEEFNLGEFGTMDCDINLRGYDAVGTYTIFLYLNEISSVIAERSFQVQEFRPPRHFCEIHFQRGVETRDDYVNMSMSEEYLECAISGKYYAGGPVKHGQVRWKIYYTGTTYKQSDHSNYTFGYPGPVKKELLESGDAILDEKGTTTVRIPLSPSVLAGMYGVEITASVIDFDGRVASAADVYQSSPDYMIGIEKHDEQINEDIYQQLKIIVLDENKRLIKSGHLDLEVFQKGWSYVRKRNKFGHFYWENHQTWRRVYSHTIPIDNKKAIFDFDFAWGGDFLITATYTHNGQAYTSGTEYSVWGDYYSYNETSEVHNVLNISTDKPSYDIGETMKVGISSRSSLTCVLLTIERDDVLFYRLLDDQRQLETTLTMADSFAPNIYVSAIGTIPRGNFPLYSGHYDQEAPSFAYGSRKIDVKAEFHRLQLSINDDLDIPPTEPGSEVSLSFASYTEKGKPVTCEMTVCVVDEAVLALTGFRTPDISKALTFISPLMVFTYESRLELLKQTPFDLLKNQPLTGGGGTAEQQAMTTKIRKDFNPVAYYNPRVITNDDGQAKVSFRLPDTMTEYRVYVVACDRGSHSGSTDTHLRVVKDFYIEPGLPRFFRSGDTFTATISAFNKTKNTGFVDLDVQTNEFIELMEPKKAYPMEEFDRMIMSLEGTAGNPGIGSVTFKGQFDDYQDAINISIPVQSPYIIDTDYIMDDISNGSTISYTFPEGTERIPWSALGEDDVNFKLIISGSPFIRVNSGLRYLLTYPYGCVEQTSSVTMPLAGLRHLIEKKLLYSITLEETDKYIKSGVDRIFSMQTSSGGFGYWPGDQQHNIWGTLYAMSALILAEKAGIELPEDRMNKALSFLAGQIKTLDADRYSERSLSGFLLAMKNRMTKELFELVYRNFDKQPREAALFCLLAAYHSKQLPLEDIKKQLQTILDWTPTPGRPRSWYTRYREDAIALLASSLIMPESPLANKQVQKLLGGLNRQGIWTSTSDTGWSLWALGEFFSGSNFGNEEVSISIWQDNKKIESFQLEPKDYHTLFLPTREFITNPQIRIEIEPDRTFLYQLEATFPRFDYQEKGYSNGFTLSKTIENTDTSDEIHIGDIVKVRIKVSIPHYGYRYVVINDPLPAGLVAINSALKTEEATPDQDVDEENYWWNYWDPDGYYRFIPHYFEIRDDRVLVFKNYSWSGDFVYTYYARAVCQGEFTMPSTKIQLMYEPHVVAYTPTKKVTILD